MVVKDGNDGGEGPLLSVQGLCKHYPSFELRDVGLEVMPGSIVGFIGRNGAGKTTTLKCIAGRTVPDAGEIRVLGRSVHDDMARQQVGFVFGGSLYYETKHLAVIAKATRRLYPSWDDAEFQRFLARFSLDLSKRVRELSQGMRVKFALALAMSHGARLLVLDEPTSGLDPLSRDELLDLFLDLASSGVTGILFSTHITSDLDKCADSLVHLRAGRIEAACPTAEYRERYRVAPLEEAQRVSAEILGIRRTVTGETALVLAAVGIGKPASLEDIMTHLDKEDNL